MSKKKLQKKQYDAEYFFVGILISCSYIVSILLIIYVFCTKSKIPDCRLYKSLDLICETVTSICVCTLSILQISLSLQNNTFLGIPIQTLYRMKKEPNFKCEFTANVIISFVFVIIIMFGNIVKSLVACIVATSSLVIFCIYLIIKEMPYLSMTEETMLKIIRDRLVAEYNGIVTAEDCLMANKNEILEILIKNKNLKWVYKGLKINYETFNKWLLECLMDVQTNIAFNLDKIESISQLSKITDELLDTTCNMVNGAFDIVEILGENIESYLHKVTCVLFKLLENNNSRDKTKKQIAEMISKGTAFDNKNKSVVKSDLFFSIMSILITENIKNNDFSLIKEIKKSLSVYPYFLQEDGVTARIFMMVSFVLYYLSKIEKEVPQEVKNNINDFVQSSYIENCNNVLSWRELFSKFKENYEVSLESFLSDFSKNQYYYKYSLKGCHTHSVTFTPELAFNWYVATYLNSERIYDTDYDTLFPIKSNPWIINNLKEIENSCYSINNREFIPNEQLKEMAKFYSIQNSVFSEFSVIENCNHKLRDCIGSLLKEEFENKISNSKAINNQDISDSVLSMINEKLKETFGFDDKIDVSNESELYFEILTEKSLDAINAKVYITDWIINNILREIRINEIEKHCCFIKAENNFSQSIEEELLQKDVEYVTPNTSCYAYNMSDNQKQKEFLDMIKKAKVIKNAGILFLKPTFILKDGFAFNCQVQILINDLTADTITQKVDEYRRTDGQYVYEGTFFTREDLLHVIKELYVVVQVKFSYKVKINENSIIVLDSSKIKKED